MTRAEELESLRREARAQSEIGLAARDLMTSVMAAMRGCDRHTVRGVLVDAERLAKICGRILDATTSGPNDGEPVGRRAAADAGGGDDPPPAPAPDTEHMKWRCDQGLEDGC